MWAGRYTCAQGVTAADLVIEVRGGAATATFAFGPLDINPTVPRGSFRMTGTAESTPTGLALNLTPDEWIEQPADYLMVGLLVEVDDNRLVGQILHHSCGRLEATRVD